VANPFFRSMRSLEADSFRPSVVGLILALVVLFAWGTWFVAARITLYETAQASYVSEKGEVRVQFPSVKQSLFKVGQYGWLHVADPDSDNTIDLPAVVMNIRNPSGQEMIELELFVLDDPNMPILTTGMPAQVEIATGNLSPAELVLQASRQSNTSANLSIDPKQLLQDLRRQ
jgi:hypothetical protein